MMFLDLLDGAEVLHERGNVPVTGLQYDSRKIRAGEVFVAFRGESTDGNRYIDAAVSAGAAAVVSDTLDPQGATAWARVAHGRRALARLSANFYGHPAAKLGMIGVTGTNGKTTTAFLVESILRAAGRESALVGTIEYHVAGKVLPAPHTTPEALELNQIFDQALQAGATEAVMEVSSHALAQQRTYGIAYDVAIFTNLTRDHLDYHKDFEDYFAAKRVLFEGCGTEPPRVSVINKDDDYGRRLARDNRSPHLLTYGMAQGDFFSGPVEFTARGMQFAMFTPGGTAPITTSLIGRVNVCNILAASAAAHARGCSLEEIAHGVADLQRVPGRFEQVPGPQPFLVVVDYAHTDDALRNLTALAREFVSRGEKRGRVITLFGCGGDRDKQKRPLMGEAAGRGSDFVVLTSDNPRSEDPVAIMEESLPGLKPTGTPYAVEADRRAAIALAIAQAKPGDIVLIAGKGHEKVQVTRAGAAPFDDVEVAREALAQAGFPPAEVAR